MDSTAVLVFVGMVFVAVFFLAQGMIVPAFGEGRQTRKRLKERLAQIEQMSDEGSIGSLLREKYLRELSPLERKLESMPLLESLRRMIEQAGHNYLAYQVLLASVALAGVGFLVVSTVMGSPALGLLAALGCGAAPLLKIQRDRANRIARFEEQLPDAIDVMRRALLAGHPFNSALKLVSQDMEDPIAREFHLTFSDLNYGNDVRRAMLGLLSRVPSVTLMALVTAVLLQRETGGNLAEIFHQISGVIRGRFKLQRKVRTLSAEGRMSAWILCLIPLLLVVAMTIINPDYLPLLIDDDTGQKVAIGAFVWAMVGILWIRRIIRIQV
jgi:tight adherence protein B